MTTRIITLFQTLGTVMLIVACCCAGCSSSQGSVTHAQSTISGAGLQNTVTVKNFEFNPPNMTVSSGTTVTWINEDGAPHTVVSDSGIPDSFTSPALAQGASFQFTFTRPGTYTYHCSIHPTMTGTVTVQS